MILKGLSDVAEAPSRLLQRCCRTLLATALVILLPGRTSSQVPTEEFGRYRVDVWRAQDGVRLAFTSNLVRTRDGYLWLSSQSGLTRFDGVRFKVFDGANTAALLGRPRLQTYPLLEDGAQRLWIGSDVGLFVDSGGVMRPAALDSTFRADQVNAATVDNHGTVWAVTRSGRIFRISPDGAHRQVAGSVPSYAASGLSVDATGDVWLVTGRRAVYRVHHDTLSTVAFPRGVLPDDARQVYAAPDTSVWIGTASAIVQWKGGHTRRIELPRGQGLEEVSSINEATDGVLWIGTHGTGLYRFDGSRFTHFTTTDGLSDNRVIDILADRDGSVWVATRDGLNRFRPLPFDLFTNRTGIPSALPGGMLADSSGSVWLAPPTGGLFRGRIDRGQAHFSPAEAVSRSDRVTALGHQHRGGVLAGHLLGSVVAFDGGLSPARKLLSGLPPVTDLLEDADGTLWVGTWRGLFRLRHGRTRRFTEQDGLPDFFVHRLYRDAQGGLWVATQTGIARQKVADNDRFVVLPMPAGSAERAIVLFEAPKGTLWVGSAEGLARVSGGRPAWLTTKQGLPEDWVGAAEVDRMGNLWLGQLGGLTRLSLDDLAAVADGRQAALSTTTRYDALEGLPGGDPGAWPHPWSFQNASGNLWFAVGHGIVRVDPAHAPRSLKVPIVHLEEITIDGVPTRLASRITLEPTSRRLEIRYTGVDLTTGPAVQFRYRMDEFDTAWTDAGTQRVASFTRLVPGHYRFRVTGRATGMPWSSSETAIDVVVLSPFYRRAWFIAAMAVSLVFLLGLLYRVKIQAKSDAIREERSRLAGEIHDSLLQGFGGVALELHAASARLRLSHEQQPLLDHVLALIDRTLAQGREAVWDIRNVGDPSEDLPTATESAVRRILRDCPTQALVVTRGRRRPLAAECQGEFLRIVEEALVNVRKHAEAKRLVVSIVYGWPRLSVTIRDDGKGFDLANAGSHIGHWGLLGMRERASRVGAKITIHSTPGAGTEVAVRFPYRPRLIDRLTAALFKD